MSDQWPPENDQASFDIRLSSLLSKEQPIESLNFGKDWQLLFTQIEEAKKTKRPQTEWFQPIQDTTPFFQDLLTEVEELAIQVNQETQVDRLLNTIDDDINNSLTCWLIICRRLSREPSSERDMVFNKVVSYVANKISDGAEDEEKQRRIFFAAYSLTKFSANFGAEAFLLGLARSQFSAPDTMNTTLNYLETTVHPFIYTPQQFFRAAQEVYQKYLTTEAAKQHFKSIFSRQFTPQGEWTPDVREFYQAKALPYYKDRGSAELQTDMEIINKAGITRDDVILDSAAGTGRHAFALQQQGFKHIVACDLSKDYVVILEQQDKDETIETAQADVLKLPFKPNAFDAVLLIGRTLLHFPNTYVREQYFTAARRVLKTGGKLIIDSADILMGDYKTQAETSQRLFPNWLAGTEKSFVVLGSMDNYLFTFRVFPEMTQLLEEAHNNGFKISDMHFRNIADTEFRNLYMIFEAS